MKVWKMISFANQNENVFFGVGDKPRNAQRKNKVSKKLFKSMKKNIYIYKLYIYIYHGLMVFQQPGKRDFQRQIGFGNSNGTQ